MATGNQKSASAQALNDGTILISARGQSVVVYADEVPHLMTLLALAHLQALQFRKQPPPPGKGPPQSP
jgi:hypothetical protein